MYTIYALVDPRDGLIHYVGKTKRAKYRAATHESLSNPCASADKTTKYAQWIRDMRTAGVVPVFSPLCDCATRQDAAFQEAFFIRKFMHLGYHLVNQAYTSTPRGYVAKADAYALAVLNKERAA